MRLTAFTDFGVRALMRLASEPARTFTTEEIAREFRISRHHLTKVLQDLAAGGYVRTSRGVGGGVQLARHPEDIRLGQVVLLLEHDHAMVECFREDGGACVITPVCRMRGALARARKAFIAELDALTLAESVRELAFPPEMAS